MSFTGAFSGVRLGRSPVDPLRAAPLEEQRRATRSDTVADATLACPRCDAPVAVGAVARRPADPLSCPWCDHRGPLRAFLTLSRAGRPRPARVVVRVSRRTVRAARQ